MKRYRVALNSFRGFADKPVARQLECVAMNAKGAVKQWAQVNGKKLSELPYRFTVYPLDKTGKELKKDSLLVQTIDVDLRTPVGVYQTRVEKLAKAKGHKLSDWQPTRFWQDWDGNADRQIPAFWTDKDARSEGEFSRDKERLEAFCTHCRRVTTIRLSHYDEPTVFAEAIGHECDFLATILCVDSGKLWVWAYPNGNVILSPTKHREQGFEYQKIETATHDLKTALNFLTDLTKKG